MIHILGLLLLRDLKQAQCDCQQYVYIHERVLEIQFIVGGVFVFWGREKMLSPPPISGSE